MSNMLEFEKTDKATYEALANLRLSDFESLRLQGQYLSAVYMSGYALEAYFKCAICKRLDSIHLPRIFRTHNLEILLFYSGLTNDLKTLPRTMTYFTKFKGLWGSGALRYKLPHPYAHTDNTCARVDTWLRDPTDGVITFLKGKI